MSGGDQCVACHKLLCALLLTVLLLLILCFRQHKNVVFARESLFATPQPHCCVGLLPCCGGCTAEPCMVLGVLASGGAEAARFAARMAERFPFLHPDRCAVFRNQQPGLACISWSVRHSVCAAERCCQTHCAAMYVCNFVCISLVVVWYAVIWVCTLP
jgi:hypothetical protein